MFLKSSGLDLFKSDHLDAGVLFPNLPLYISATFAANTSEESVLPRSFSKNNFSLS